MTDWLFSVEAEEVAEWITEHLPRSTVQVGRPIGGGHCLLINFADDVDRVAFHLRWM